MFKPRYVPSLILICCVIVIGLAFGTRQSFGLFMRPITLDLAWSRETLSLIFGLQALLNGLAAPFAGAVSDKWGTGRTVFVGGMLYCVGLLVMSQSTTLGTMLFGGGLLVGMGISACGMPVLLAAVGKIAPPHKRSQWMGIVTAGATAGQLVTIPVLSELIVRHGWSYALFVAGLCFLIIAPLALCIGWAGRASTTHSRQQTLGQAISEARRHSGYLLLTLGFFVCGFQVQFIASHLPAFIADEGLSAKVGATALVVIAISNMVGAWTAGFLGDRVRKKYLLSCIYLCRAVVLAAFVLLPMSEVTVLTLCVPLGFFWLATVPLTSGLVAQIFGVQYMATLYAIVYVSHQFGNFMGAWLGGRIFDMTGSYDLVWWIAVVLGLVAAILHVPIDDHPVDAPVSDLAGAD